MQVQPKNIANVALAIRWGLLVLAGIALFVFEWLAVGLFFAVVGLGFGIAMRFAVFRDWFAGKITK